jgi:Xaa-Pro aminopeptidase
MRARLERLRPLIAEAALDVLLVVGADNRRYLSGFTGSAGALLVSSDGARLVADFRYWQQAAEQAPDFAIVRMPPMTRLETILPGLVAEHGWQRIGVEADHLTLEAFDLLTQALAQQSATLVKTTGLVERLRQAKDAEELRRIQAAVDLTDAAMEHAAGLLRPGVSEAEVAWAVEAFMRTHGAQEVAFPAIVAFGANSALPHHHPSAYQLRAADPIVIDMGARVDGYCADLTRSFCLAPADDHYAEVYAIVLEALRTAEQRMHAGLTGQQADAIGRAVITEHGYGEFFGHGLGHSLGLAIHEAPALSRLNDQPMPAGAIETVEPGIYLPEWGGVRIEDVVVLEDEGTRVLTGSPK